LDEVVHVALLLLLTYQLYLNYLFLLLARVGKTVVDLLDLVLDGIELHLVLALLPQVRTNNAAEV
jgi:hypothetical protein